ncbi:MAG: hypothetical protein K5829_10540 [Treponema sp.]|nr:hypothetical protein [Treponema sp.]
MMQNEIEYGYPSLAKINSFIRNCIGDEPLLQIENVLEELGEHPYKEQKSVITGWNRLCDDKYQRFEKYKYDSTEGLVFFVKSFLLYMKEKYDLSEPIIRLILSSYSELFNLLQVHKEQSFPIVPDLPTKEIIKTVIFSNLIKIAYVIIEKSENKKFVLEYFLSEDLNYSTVINAIKEDKKQTWEAIYCELDSKVEKEKIKGKKDAAERFDKIIKDCIKKNKNPPWYNFWIMFEWASQDLNIQLLEVYLLNKYRESLMKTFKLSTEELKNIKQDLIDYLNGAEKDKIFSHYMSLNNRECSKLIRAYLKPNLYLNKKKYFEEMKEIFINVSEKYKSNIREVFLFFEPWLKGYVSVAERKFGEAQKYYKLAFESKYLAGDYILPFLKQAFVLELYCNGSWSKPRQAADPNCKNITPICEQAQFYWNYGYTLDIFEKPATDTFLESFRIYKNFYNEFPPEIFEHPDNVKRIQMQEICTEMGIYFDDELPPKKMDKFYNLISSYTNESQDLNELKKHPISKKDINDKENKLYSPFSLCVAFGSQDERFLDLAEKWIDYPKLNVGKRCFNNSTALLEALTQYKNLRLHGKNDVKTIDLIKRYKTIIEKIIQRSKVQDLCETKIHKIHVLQEAINAFDLDLVKHIIEKGIDINEILIDADELSPLYFAIGRKGTIAGGYEKFVQKQRDNPFNLTWENYDAPGLTMYDKALYKNKMINSDKYYQSMKNSFVFNYGQEKTYKKQIEELDKIIEYLISKTTDVDKFVKYFDKKQGTNALFLAAEYDDLETCKKLIEHNANTQIVLGDAFLCTVLVDYGYYEYVYFNNAFIYRLIFFKAWKTLDDFLTKHKELAKKTMTPNKFGITPIIYFLWNTKNDSNRMKLLEKYIPLFEEAGANLKQPSIIGSTKQIIKSLEKQT